MNSYPILDGSSDPKRTATMSSRREAMRTLGGLGGTLALVSVPALAFFLANRALAQGGLTQDVIDILNFALTLEYLEKEFYDTGTTTAGLISTPDRPAIGQIKRHEDAHVALLQQLLGTDAIAKPTFDFTASGQFPDVFSNYTTFLTLAQGFEDAGVRAYKGQAQHLMSNDAILTAALQLHSVEARHAAEVRRMRQQKGWITFNNTDVTSLAAIYAGEENHVHAGVDVGNTEAGTEAFDEPLTKEQVLAIVRPFIA
jgi:hypothetical protein